MKKKYNGMFALISLILVVITTIAYSAFTSSLQIQSEAKLRAVSDIRVTGVSLVNNSGATIQYESNYGVNTISSGFVLPTSSSSITYKVQVTNDGTIDQTIYDILTQSSNNSGLTYEISNYNLREVIGFKSVVEFNITYRTTTPSTEPINVVNKFDFRKVYHVRYDASGIVDQIKIERVPLVLTLSEPHQSGKKFKGWTDVQGGQQAIYGAGAIYALDVDVLLHPVYELEKYNIHYVLNGGKLASGVTNPAYYTIETSSFTLNNPTKSIKVVGNVNGSGATVGDPTTTSESFLGWFGSNGTTPQTTVTIPTSDMLQNPQNVEYKAKWATSSVSLPIARKEGYTCKWYTESTGGSLMGESGGTWIPTSETQSEVIAYARCTANEYKITLDKNGATNNP